MYFQALNFVSFSMHSPINALVMQLLPIDACCVSGTRILSSSTVFQPTAPNISMKFLFAHWEVRKFVLLVSVVLDLSFPTRWEWPFKLDSDYSSFVCRMTPKWVGFWKDSCVNRMRYYGSYHWCAGRRVLWQTRHSCFAKALTPHWLRVISVDVVHQKPVHLGVIGPCISLSTVLDSSQTPTMQTAYLVSSRTCLIRLLG